MDCLILGGGEGGGGVLVKVEFSSTASQIQKEDAIDNLLTVFKGFFC